jgi:hypothetical protein
MLKTTAKASQAIDAALASVEASNKRLAALEESGIKQAHTATQRRRKVA